MVNCSAQRQPTGILEQGGHRVPWRSDATLCQFVTSIFPTTDHPRYILLSPNLHLLGFLPEDEARSQSFQSSCFFAQCLLQKRTTDFNLMISLNGDDPRSSDDIKAALMAKKLKKRAGLSFRPTDDLRDHLQLDRKTGSVEIYHHTAFLKEHLRLTKESPKGMSVSDSLRL